VFFHDISQSAVDQFTMGYDCGHGILPIYWLLMGSLHLDSPLRKDYMAFYLMRP
jgi:hypothetical protein